MSEGNGSTPAGVPSSDQELAELPRGDLVDRIDSLEAELDAKDERLDDLETAFESFKADVLEAQDNYQSQVVRPALDGLREACDDARDERVELRERVDALQTRVDQQEADMTNLVGIDDNTASSPKKRALDLRIGLYRRAKDRSDNEGYAAMHWKEVQNFLADQNHGDVSKPDCHKAMQWAANEDGSYGPGPLPDVAGFTIEEAAKRKSTKQGSRWVTAIKLKIADLPESWVNNAIRASVGNPTEESEGTEAETPRRNPTTRVRKEAASESNLEEVDTSSVSER